MFPLVEQDVWKFCRPGSVYEFVNVQKMNRNMLCMLNQKSKGVQKKGLRLRQNVDETWDDSQCRNSFR